MKLSKFEDGEKENPTLFKSLVGSLRYLTCTRPDILYVVGVVSRFMETSTSTHMKVAKMILHYLKGTLDYGYFIHFLMISNSMDFVIVIMPKISMIERALVALYSS